MRRPQLDPPPGFRLDPSAENATAWKNERVGPVTADDGEFKIAVERGNRRRLPPERPCVPLAQEAFESFRELIALSQELPTGFQAKQIGFGARITSLVGPASRSRRSFKADPDVIAEPLEHRPMIP
jgi:hypothetical protein